MKYGWVALISFVDHAQIVKSIMDAVTIPVMAKCRIGHFAEAQILESLDVDFIDESEGKGKLTACFERACV